MGGRDAAVSKKKMPGRNLGLAFVRCDGHAVSLRRKSTKAVVGQRSGNMQETIIIATCLPDCGQIENI